MIGREREKQCASDCDGKARNTKGGWASSRAPLSTACHAGYIIHACPSIPIISLRNIYFFSLRRRYVGLCLAFLTNHANFCEGDYYSYFWCRYWERGLPYFRRITQHHIKSKIIKKDTSEIDMQEVWPGLLRMRRAFLAHAAQPFTHGIFPKKIMRWVSGLFKVVQIHRKRKAVEKENYRLWW